MSVWHKLIFLCSVLLATHVVYGQTEPDSVQLQTNQPSNAHRLHAESQDTALSFTRKTGEKTPSSFTISADVRFRSELRHGYRNVAIKDTTASFFVNQRSRLNFNYQSKRLKPIRFASGCKGLGPARPARRARNYIFGNGKPNHHFPGVFF